MLLGTLRCVIYLTAAAVLLGLDVSSTDWSGLVVMVLLGALAALGIGICLAAVAVAFSHGDAVGRAAVVTLGLLSGAYFPISAMPAPMRWAARYCPPGWRSRGSGPPWPAAGGSRRRCCWRRHPPCWCRLRSGCSPEDSAGHGPPGRWSVADAWGSWAAAARCLALDAFAARTAELLTAAGVDNLLLKGPATAHRLYPDRLDLRTYNDVDLLVRADRFDAAQEVLRCSGYGWMLAGVRDGEFSWHEIAWRAPGSADLLLDLHRGFAGVHDHSAFFDDLWASREQLDLSGVPIDIPSAAGTALILALHAASPGRGRKPLADIQRAHQVFPIEVWREAAELARRCAAEPACRAGLGLLPERSGIGRRDRCRRGGDGRPVARRPAVRSGERQPRRGHRSTRNQGPRRLCWCGACCRPRRFSGSAIPRPAAGRAG